MRALLPTLLLLAACETMEPSGALFEPASAPATAAPAPAAPVADAAFEDAPTLVLTSEQMQGSPGGPGLAEAAGVDPDSLPAAPETAGAAVAPPVEAAAAAPPQGLPAATQWPVRLLSTLPQAQPPRAILGLPSGEERVVSPGSILAEQGLVVMTVTSGKVQLAQVEPAGDHARITTVEITAQYPP